MSLLDRLAPRRPDADGPQDPSDAPVFSTKALGKFLALLTPRTSPVLLDLGPVVGSNVSFFGEHFGCKIFVEDLFADLDRLVRERKVGTLPAFLGTRFPQADGTVDAVLCWDIVDYLDKASARVLADELTRVLRPEGVLLGFFATGRPSDNHYTKYIIADRLTLKHRAYPALGERQAVLLNRDIIRLFSGLRVSDSFLLHNNQREILFRKPA